MSNPYEDEPRRAVALTYSGHGAPRLSAKGEGHVAEQILALADASGVHVHEDEHLAAVLARVPLGDEIPEALFLAVAQVLAFAYGLSHRALPPPADGQEP